MKIFVYRHELWAIDNEEPNDTIEILKNDKKRYHIGQITVECHDIFNEIQMKWKIGYD